MRFVQTPLPGAVVLEPEPLADERGWFARTFDAEAFRAHGLNPEVVQMNASFNTRSGTLRGMHYQADPHGESKLVRCVSGAIFDVAVDLRPDSPTYCRWHGVELSAENGAAFYIPAGLAHGFQTAPRCTTRWATPTCRMRAGACAGTTPPSRSPGPRPLRAGA